MMRCPNCGAVLIYNNEKRIYVCEYCGYNEVVLEKVVYQPVVQAPKYNYNLLISNRATAPIAKIRFTIADSNISRTLDKNETTSFLLAPGPHKVFFRCGKYNRTFVIVALDNADPVQILYNGGGTNFEIIQPYAGEEYKDLKDGMFPAETSVLSIISFALTFTFLFSLWGVILGLADMSNASRNGVKNSSLSAASVAIGSVFTMMGWLIITVVSR